MQNLKPLSLSVFLFALARERFFIKTHSTESRWVIDRKYTVCRCVCASFNQEIIQARAVKGLSYVNSCITNKLWSLFNIADGVERSITIIVEEHIWQEKIVNMHMLDYTFPLSCSRWHRTELRYFHWRTSDKTGSKLELHVSSFPVMSSHAMPLDSTVSPLRVKNNNNGKL